MFRDLPRSQGDCDSSPRRLALHQLLYERYGMIMEASTGTILGICPWIPKKHQPPYNYQIRHGAGDISLLLKIDLPWWILRILNVLKDRRSELYYYCLDRTRQSSAPDHPATQLGLSTDKITILVTFTKELPQNVLPNRISKSQALFRRSLSMKPGSKELWSRAPKS